MNLQNAPSPKEINRHETGVSYSSCDLPVPCSSRPFLRWAGGKRWLASSLSEVIKRRLTSSNGHYIEPFLGSGAIFFSVCPKQSILNDLNRELMLAYAVLRDQPHETIKILKSWPVEKDNYYKIRNWLPDNNIEKACRFIWLNRTCYGGLYRTNRSGKFNTPYGGGSRVPDSLWTTGTALACASNLRRGSELYSGDFESIIDKAKEGDVVFCDPTYSNHSKDHFDRYGASVFSWSDQIRLAHACRRAASRGATVVVTNGAYSEIAEIYPDAYRITKRRSVTFGKSHVNGTDREFVFILDPVRRRKDWSVVGPIENRVRAVRGRIDNDHREMSSIKSHLPSHRSQKVVS
ncbi:Dam family site-specific DNA-(adenine-N6)-methyltransferase [Ruegeria arenilitoris]|uniref:Dam family site-specific DNA-(adenine-N6)-methyltransferase n=1 Tax=Ruegeria arenilitoris TaxID=1173585 RepID=UPI00147B46BE